MSAIARSYYEACRRYQEGDDPSAEDWAAWESRMSAVGILIDGGYVPVPGSIWTIREWRSPGL